MALTETQYKNVLLIELNKSSDTSFADLVDSYWEMFAPAANVSLQLQYWYVKRFAILALMAQSAEYVDWRDADTERKSSQRMKNYQMLLESLERQIARVENELGDAAPIAGLLTRYTLADLNLPVSYPYRNPDPARIP